MRLTMSLGKRGQINIRQCDIRSIREVNVLWMYL